MGREPCVSVSDGSAVRGVKLEGMLVCTPGVKVSFRAAVDTLAKRVQDDGFPLLDGPRRTGDGYYESMVADPEGNRIVIAE